MNGLNEDEVIAPIHIIVNITETNINNIVTVLLLGLLSTFIHHDSIFPNAAIKANIAPITKIVLNLASNHKLVLTPSKANILLIY
jgi:hypothetical protein